MQYIEMTIGEAIIKCKKNTKILVATQDLAEENVDIIFVPKREDEYDEVFENVKKVESLCDSFIQQLKLFTEKQDIRNIKPYGIQRIVILKE